MIDYSDCSQEEFDRILREIIGNMTPHEILSYGDVYTILAEELNNQVLECWEAQKELEREQEGEEND